MKEEIEQLAKQLCGIPIDLVIDEEEKYYKNLQKYDGIILGYTQCQEDMADKKYTEEEVIELLQKALTHQNDAEIGSLVTTQKEIRPSNFYSWFNKFKKT